MQTTPSDARLCRAQSWVPLSWRSRLLPPLKKAELSSACTRLAAAAGLGKAQAAPSHQPNVLPCPMPRAEAAGYFSQLCFLLLLRSVLLLALQGSGFPGSDVSVGKPVHWESLQEAHTWQMLSLHMAKQKAPGALWGLCPRLRLCFCLEKLISTAACDSLGSCKPWKFAFKKPAFSISCCKPLFGHIYTEIRRELGIELNACALV